MADTVLKQKLLQSLMQFSGGNLAESANALLGILGYKSQKRIELDPNTPQSFLAEFDKDDRFNAKNALLDEWQTVDFLFQLADEEVQSALSSQDHLFANKQVNNTIINSYLFFAIRLRGERYTRTQLAAITREVNKLFPMPALILFQHGEMLTLSIVARRVHKRDQSKDVLEKVTLIKDICTSNHNRAHVEILHDLAIQTLSARYAFTNFVELQRAWEKTLDTSELNKRFYCEVANWYFWAKDRVTFPDGAGQDVDTRNATSVIRLITRLIFVWFLKEKRLVPDDFFNLCKLKDIMKFDDPNGSTYYKAILQNLFFATLNQEMNTPEKPDQRKFRGKASQHGGRDQHHLITNLYRYEKYFKEPAHALELFTSIPFLNGGLFECLDKPDKDDPAKTLRVDGFSDRSDNTLVVGDELFFGEECEIDLNEIYGTRNKTYKVRGLVNIFESYKFTIEENTPIEEEIALDPELLGKVFENLLASYNPETGTTARKQTGSFYTPREIVNYMVDESLIAYLENAVLQASSQLEESRKDVGAACAVPQASSLLEEPDQDTGAELQITRRNLPHWRWEGATYFVTFRLADSIPQAKLTQWREERETWLKHNPTPWNEEQESEYKERFTERMEEWMNAGMGTCHLRQPEIAKIVADALCFFDGQRYHLGEWVVMPNHIHVLVTPLGKHQLTEILHSWKSFSAKEINKVLKRQGTLWLEESYDHIVRNQKELERIAQYIRSNPEKAGITVPQASSLWELDSPNLEEDYRQDACNTDANLSEVQELVASTELPLGERLRYLLAYNDEPPQFNDQERQTLIEAIDSIKVLDPACGSGAFPMGILHKLVHILKKLDPGNQHWKERQIAKASEIPDATVREKVIEDIEQTFSANELDYGRKLYLIENCIYGVDIQPIAVQIAKLRFFISLIVDQCIDDAKENRGIRPLPNLETKFVAANSLIGIERPKKYEQLAFKNQLVEQKERELAEIRRNHFAARTLATKRKYREMDNKLRFEISELLKMDGFPSETTRRLAYWDPYDHNGSADFFDSEWMFGITGGFDIVIGNPPYISHDKILKKDALKEKFKSYEPFADIYCYFIEQAIRLQSNKGLLSFITSNSYLRAEYGNPIRKIIRKENEILDIINLEDAQVFESAIVNVAILVSSRKKVGKKSFVFNAPCIENADFSEFIRSKGFYYEQSVFDTMSWSLIEPEKVTIQRKIEKSGITLEQLGTKIRLGLATGHNDAFIINERKRKEFLFSNPRNDAIIKPILRGRDIYRYHYKPPNSYILLTKNGVNVQRDFPDIYKYLDGFGDAFKKRGAQGQHWTNLRACAFFDDFKEEKIVWIELTDIGRFALSTNEIYLLNTAYFLIPPRGIKIKYLLGVLNSKLIQFYLSTIAETSGMGTNRWINNYVKEFPIIRATDEKQNSIVKLVDQILISNEMNALNDTSAREAEVDRLVYKLYELTKGEIAIVEETVR